MSATPSGSLQENNERSGVLIPGETVIDEAVAVGAPVFTNDMSVPPAVSLQPHHLATFLQQCFNSLRCERQQFIDSAVRLGGEFFEVIS
ncbi:hypothetical protein [Nitrosomonas sp.]|uniref:hypothetical protein n=1 Tax=Nitrosomonas sp. TaxID=42353 RepID=UPI00272FED3F|nr:hypothetical protein [Nitrosomonas sp.]MDP2224469.1 hypothetical protein [Nitrosomonas sp.]